MVQQQIVDYIKAQLKAGVGKDAVRNALMGVGWPEKDVEDSIKSVESAKEAAPATTPTILVSDLIGGSKSEVAQTAKSAPYSEAAPKTIETLQVEEKPKTKFSKPTILIVVLSVIVVGLAAASVFLYLRYQSENDALSSENSIAAAKISDLTAQINTVNTARDALSAQNVSLSGENQTLKTELSLLVAPLISATSTATSSEATAALKGALSGGGKTPYAITTANGVKVYVKNYKDEKVDAALKPLLGQEVELVGTYVPGSKEMTVSSVNGAAL